MIEPYYIILFSTISGSLSYLIWKIFEIRLSKERRYKYLYYMLLLVAALYLVPLFYLETMSIITLSKRNFKSEMLYLWTPRIAEIRTILAFIWLCGVIWGIQGGFHKLKGIVGLRIKNILPAEDELVQLKDNIVKELKIRQKVDICRSYSVISPMVIGIWKKTIFVPISDYEQNEIEILLYHELIHVKQHITGFKNLVAILQIFQWFNPCVYVLMGALDEWSETLCDLEVQYKTRCKATIKEYFSFAIREAEREQVMLSSFLTKLQRMKGLSARFEKVASYDKEKELSLVNGVIVMLSFLIVFSTSFLLICVGVLKLHNSLYNATEVETKIVLATDNYIEYEELLIVEEQEGILELPCEVQKEKSFIIESEILPCQLLYSNYFDAEGSDKIMVSICISPNNLPVKIGIMSDDTRIYVNEQGMLSHTFDVSKTDKYRIFIENENNVPVTTTCFVAYSN